MTNNRTRTLIAGCLLVGTALAGCSSTLTSSSSVSYPSLSCPAKAGGAVTLVVGARANSPHPSVPAEVQGLISMAATAQQKVQVIRLDGAPSVALKATFATSAHNDQIRSRDLKQFIGQIVQFAQQGLEPKAPQVDVLGALTLAGQVTPPGGSVVLMDSGLPTTGPLSYQNQDMFGAAPAEVAAFLKSQNLMPDFSQLAVILAGVGYTAAPQPPLAPNVQAQLVKLWTTLADDANASCVQRLKSAPGGGSIETTVPVAVVQPPPPPAFHDCGTTVLSDGGSVGFNLNSAVFRDPQAARSALQQLAGNLLARPQETATLTGETSSEGDPARNLELSRQRADAVKDQLVQLGVSGSRITTVGAGSAGPGHKPDMVNGALDPVKAEHNRAVVVQLVCA